MAAVKIKSQFTVVTSSKTSIHTSFVWRRDNDLKNSRYRKLYSFSKLIVFANLAAASMRLRCFAAVKCASRITTASRDDFWHGFAYVSQSGPQILIMSAASVISLSNQTRRLPYYTDKCRIVRTPTLLIDVRVRIAGRGPKIFKSAARSWNVTADRGVGMVVRAAREGRAEEVTWPHRTTAPITIIINNWYILNNERSRDLHKGQI